jgi:phage regulator Rha-like protein
MNACLDLRDRFYSKSSFYPHLYSFMIEQFDLRFPEYFQEIYDADMQEVDLKEYEDSPAGFRLVCKHGRRDASLWSMVQDQEQFIDSLVEFFTYAEPQISAAAEEKNCDDDIKEIITLMIHHVQTEVFIRSAFHRSASLHNVSVDKKNLSDLHRLEKKPWSYTSGGVMNTLIKTYYRRDSEVSEETFTIQSEADLLHLLIETMKSLPYNFTAYFPEKWIKKF